MINANKLVAPDGYVFVVLVANYWGKGHTILEAARACEKAGGKTDGSFTVLLADPKAYVNEMGGVTRPAKSKDTIEVGTFKLPKAQPRYMEPAPGKRDCPDFARWSDTRLAAESERLGMPHWEGKTREELIDALTEAYV